MWSVENPIPVTLWHQRLDRRDDCQTLIEPRRNPFADLLDYGIGNWSADWIHSSRSPNLSK